MDCRTHRGSSRLRSTEKHTRSVRYLAPNNACCLSPNSSVTDTHLADDDKPKQQSIPAPPGRPGLNQSKSAEQSSEPAWLGLVESRGAGLQAVLMMTCLTREIAKEPVDARSLSPLGANIKGKRLSLFFRFLSAFACLLLNSLAAAHPRHPHDSVFFVLSRPQTHAAASTAFVIWAARQQASFRLPAAPAPI